MNTFFIHVIQVVQQILFAKKNPLRWKKNEEKVFGYGTILALRKICSRCTTLESESKVPFPRQLHHPISLASFNLKGWNLVCGTLWPNPALTQNFSPNGLVVLEIWQNMWFFPHFEKEGKMERREKWQLWQKWQPAAQATGASEMENNKKGWLQWKITILIEEYEKV